jgi:hypothetical protein
MKLLVALALTWPTLLFAESTADLERLDREPFDEESRPVNGNRNRW